MTTRRCAQARRLPIVGLILPLALAASPAPLPSGDPAQAPLLSGVPEDVAALLEPIRSRHRLPALAGAVLLGDTLVALGATGVRKRGADVAVTTSDLWHLGSCGKAMTATVIARLVERGQLRWDTTLAEGLPELGDAMHRDYRGVTLSQLLSHRGGLPGDLTTLPVWSWLWSHQGSTTEERDALVRSLLGQRPEARPGTRYVYSNGGYTVAARVAERATGRTWEELVRRELFEPLGMRSAGFGAPGDTGSLDQPWGHSDPALRRGLVAPGPRADNPSAIAPAGTIHSTLSDWARFVRLHLLGARGGTHFLSAAAFRKLHAPIEGQDYALGWLSLERSWGGGESVLTHAGSNTLWYAVVWIAPKRNFAVLVATNEGGDRARKGTDQAAWALIQHAETLSPDS